MGLPGGERANELMTRVKAIAIALVLAGSTGLESSLV